MFWNWCQMVYEYKSILEHQITVNGSGLHVYHLRCIGSVPQREGTVYQPK